jgi:hypothetical protein
MDNETNPSGRVDPPAPPAPPAPVVPPAPIEIVCPACASKVTSDGRDVHKKSDSLLAMETAQTTAEDLRQQVATLTTKNQELELKLGELSPREKHFSLFSRE